MEFKDEKGKIIAVDDPRLDPVWDKCGELKIPVLIHSADPKAFWFPEDEHNERWLEIATHPDRQRSNTNPPLWDSIIEQQHRMFKKHPNTTFIAAHFGWLGGDLATLGKLLDEMPNVNVEFGAIISILAASQGCCCFSINTRTVFCSAKTHGCHLNIKHTSGYWKPKMNIFLTTKISCILAKWHGAAG